MIAFVLKRMAAALPVMAVVAAVVFAILRLTPGDPAAILAGDSATPEQLENTPGVGRQTAQTIYEYFHA